MRELRGFTDRGAYLFCGIMNVKVRGIYARSISAPDRIPEDFHYRPLQFTM